MHAHLALLQCDDERKRVRSIVTGDKGKRAKIDQRSAIIGGAARTHTHTRIDTAASFAAYINDDEKKEREK